MGPPSDRASPVLPAPRLATVLLAVLLPPLSSFSAVRATAPGCVGYSWANATVLIPPDPAAAVEGDPLRPGDRIVALAPDGTCVGEADWDGRGAALSLWADDPYTEARDGLAEGDPVSFALYPAGGDSHHPAPLMFTFRPAFSPARGFALDKVYLVSTATASEPDRRSQNRLGPVRPNPARVGARVTLSLDAAAEVHVYVLDMLGRRVATPFSGRLGPGDHDLALDVSGLTPGTYVCWARSGEAVSQRRFTVVR